jgi:hypothetical protein
LPLLPGRAERHGFEYYRHGTLSLLACLDTRSDEVLAQTLPRHIAAFVGLSATSPRANRRAARFMWLWTIRNPRDPAARTFLVERNVRLHFTPADAQLNQVELTVFGEDRGRPTSPRHLHLDRRSGAKHSTVHPRLHQNGESIRWSYRPGCITLVVLQAQA